MLFCRDKKKKKKKAKHMSEVLKDWRMTVTALVVVAGTYYWLASRPKRTAAAPKAGDTKMKKVFCVEPNADMNKVKLETQTVPVPKLKSGQVLVKMAAAPVNPSDYGAWLAKQEGVTYPKAIGNEGSGTVVASGGGFLAGRLVGKNVGVVAQSTGSFAEYVVTDAMTGAFPLSTDVDVKDAASFFVNPYTAVAILDTVTSTHGKKAFVHTAAASQLGIMMQKLALTKGITIINVVRRQEQADALKKLGPGVQVVLQAGADWETHLKAKIDEFKVSIAFDCIAGDMTGTLIGLLPNRGTCYVYGGLSKQPVGNIHPRELIYRSKQVKGFLLPHWLQQGGMISTLRRINWSSKVVNSGLKKGGWAESKFSDASLDSWETDFLRQYNETGFTGAKLRITF